MQLMGEEEIPCFLEMEGERNLLGSFRVKNKILRALKRRSSPSQWTSE